MEFLTGVKEKETVSVSEILSGDYVGKTVKMNGAVHNIRDMGEFAFVILRKAEGLVQCVYEDGKTDLDLKELKEESAVEVTGVVALEERAPQGFELRLTGIRVLSQPAETMPIAIAAGIARNGCPESATDAPTTAPSVKQPSVERSHTFSME